MLVTLLEDEENFMELEPDIYRQNLLDIISFEFKMKNFRTSGFYLMNKICETYDGMKNFVLSFSLEMLNIILNGGNIQTGFSEYNVYLKNIKDSLINKFNDAIKMDFALFIILTMKDHLEGIKYFREKLRDILSKNQEKLNSIKHPVIKIKLCVLYLFFLKILLKEHESEKNEKLSKKEIIENIINYLLNNIIQKNSNNYLQVLSYEASESIINLLTELNENESKNSLLILYISENLEKNFSILNNLIENVDADPFFSVIDHILSDIKIKDRQLVFDCLTNLSRKFQKNFLSQNDECKSFCSKYFHILLDFLSGNNKINAENKEEIKKFNEIFDHILNYIKNPQKFLFYESLVSITKEYINNLKGINERSALVLKNIKIILAKEKTTSEVCFTFVSTFLSYIQNNISEEPLNQQELFNEILTIINLSFSFDNDSLSSSKINALLLVLQVFSLNPNLSENVFKELIINCLNSFLYFETDDIFPSDRNNINQLSLATVSLGFIFKTDLTFNILINSVMEIKNNSNNVVKNDYTRFDKYIHCLMFLFRINYPDYNPLLGKSIILGICGMLSDKTCLEYLNKEQERKLYILKTFINLVFNHKKEKITILNKLMKKEMKCNFVESDEDEYEEEEEEIDDEFNEKVETALSLSENINSSDEFQFFSKIMMYFKETEKDIYDHLIQQNSTNKRNLLEDLLKVRNIKIKYNNKEFTVPRKTVIIKRNNK